MGLKIIHLCLGCLREVCYRMQALGQWASLLRTNVNVSRQRVQYTGSELAQIPNLLTLSLQNVSLKKMKRPMHPTLPTIFQAASRVFLLRCDIYLFNHIFLNRDGIKREKFLGIKSSHMLNTKGDVFK